MRSILRLGALPGMLIAALLAGRPAAGQDQPPPAEEAGPALTFDLTAGVWYPRLGGKTTLGPSAAGSVDLESGFNLNDSEVTLNAELTVGQGREWYARFSGFDFSTDSAGTFSGSEVFGSLTLTDGDPFRASLDIFSVGGDLGINLLPSVGIGPGDTELRFVPEIGARYIEVEQTVELVGGGRESPSAEWIGAYGGLTLHLHHRPDGGMPIGNGLRLEGGAALGPVFGDEIGFIWLVRAGITLEATDNLGLTFGYRLLELDAEDGDWEFDGGLQGLFLGGTLSF